MRLKSYIISALFGLAFATVGFPCISGYRPDIGISSLISVLGFAILLGLATRILLLRKNYFAMMLVFILICGYSLKLAYLELLVSSRYESVSSDVILKTLFDTFNVGYLEYDSQIYTLYLLSYVTCLLGVIAAALFMPAINFSQVRLLLKFKKKSTLNGSIVFIVSFLIAAVVGLAILNSISFGISSGDAADVQRLPFKIDTLIYAFMRYGLTLIGLYKYVQINTCQINGKYPLGIIIKGIILLYFIIFSLYSTSKEYLFVAIFLASVDLVRPLISKYKFGTLKKLRWVQILEFLIKLSLIVTVAVTVLSANTASRFVRNAGICSNCSGIEASRYAISAIFDGEIEDIQRSIGNSESLLIPLKDQIALSTILRIQGAENLLQIITKNHTSDRSPDIFGPFMVLTESRLAGHEFYYYEILPFRRIGVDLAVAFPPSLVGLSLQKSINFINPAIFGSTFYVFYAVLILTLFSSRMKASILIGLLMTYEALKSFSEGAISSQLLFLSIAIAIFFKILTHKKQILDHA